MNTQDKQIEHGIFALFKGPSGSGKSVGAMSFPDPIVLDFDRKMPAIALKHFPKKSIEYCRFEKLEDITKLVDDWVKDKNCPYETVIIDSITTAALFLIRELSEMVGEKTSVQLQSIRKTAKGDSMPDAINISIYNHEVRFFNYLLDNFKILWSRPGNPKNVIFIAHVIAVESSPDLKTKLITKTRSIITAGKKAAAYIPTEFDNVFNFGFREEGGFPEESTIKHVMISQTIGDDEAKCAYNLARVTDFTNKPLYDEIQKQIRGAEIFQ